MMRRTTMMALLFVLFTACLVLPSPLHLQVYAADTGPGENNGPNAPVEATGEAKTQVTGGSTITCDTLPEAQGGALIGKIVPCLVYTIQQSTVKFTEEMVTWLQPVLFTFLLLVVVLYGVRVMQHEPEVYKQGFLLLVKIAVITTILADLGNIHAYDNSGSTGKLIPAVYGVMSDAQQVVAGAITTTNLKCDIANYQGAQTPKVWAMMDCVMGKLYGFTVSGGAGKPSMLLMTSVAGLLTGFLFGGAWGVAVFFGMIGVLFTMFSLVIRTVVGFLTGYLIVCLMLILCPLFLPMAFMRATTPYYESVTRTIMAAFLTPLIITAYTMFALILYDKMLFADDSIVQKLFKYDMIKDAIQPSKKGCDRQVTGKPLELRVNTSATAADKDTLLSAPGFENLAQRTLSGGNDLCNTVKYPVFKYNKMDGMQEGKEKDQLTQIFMQFVQLFILAYLISQGQEMLPGIVTQLVGRRSTTVGVKAIMENEGKFTHAYQSAMQSATSVFQKKPGDPNSGYKSGGDFARNIVGDLSNATRDGGKSYMNTLKK